MSMLEEWFRHGSHACCAVHLQDQRRFNSLVHSADLLPFSFGRISYSVREYGIAHLYYAREHR